MSCDNSTYCTDVVAPHFSPTVKVGDHATAPKTDLRADKQSRSGLNADRSKPKACRNDVQSRIIPDSTEIDPEYVWGDEGPFND
jgi:hypothetical protein